MTPANDAWLARHRARWLRPNAHLYVRPDAHRFMQPDAGRFLRPDFKSFVQPGFAPFALPRLEGKANFNPNQPRVPKGDPDGGQWTSVGGSSGSEEWEVGEGTDGRASGDDDSDFGQEGSPKEGESDAGENGDNELPTDFSASRIRYRIVGLPEPTLSQLGRLANANARFDHAVHTIRQVDPNWRGRTESASDPNNNEGIIRHAEARALEAEAHLSRLGIGGNLGPPLEPPPFGTSLPTMRPFNGPVWIDAYRALANTTDLFGREAWSREKGTVSVTEFGGTPIFGINAAAPTYTSSDLSAALEMRDILIHKYPDIMSADNTGARPNDSLFHAEATILLRAAKANGGTLADKALEVHVDRSLCSSCDSVLPHLGTELGNPRVTYVTSATRRRRTMWNGRWLD